MKRRFGCKWKGMIILNINKCTLEEIVKICKDRNDCIEKDNLCPFLDGNCMFLDADGNGMTPCNWYLNDE